MIRPLKNRVRNRLILLAQEWDRPAPSSCCGDAVDRRPPKEYPQLWAFNVGLRVAYPRLSGFLKWLCWLFVGHEPSKTEWGYGGGPYVDRWCRWCNEKSNYPKNAALDDGGPEFVDQIRAMDQANRKRKEEQQDGTSESS